MNEQSGDDRLAEDLLERNRVGRQLAAVAGDALGAGGAGPPCVGLVVDDDETSVGAHEQVDVALEHPIADERGDEQLAVVLGLDGGTDDRRRECGAGERLDVRLEADDALGSALGSGEVGDVVAVGEIAELERPVDGAPDSGAVSPTLPGWELEVDGVFAEPFVGPGAGIVPGREVLGEPCGADREPARGGGHRPLALGRPLVGVVPRADRPGAMRDQDVPAGFGDQRLRAASSSAAPPPASEERPCGSLASSTSGFVGHAMQRHDEVVDCPCARDVQQAPPLCVAHLLVDRLEVVVDVVGAACWRSSRCRCARRRCCRGGPTAAVVRPLTTVIGNSSPLAAWIVMIRTAS